MIAAAVLAVATVAFAQKPDFSGTWTPDAAAASGAPGGRRRRWRRTPRRRHGGPDDRQADGDHADRSSALRASKVVTTYKLDGTETENKMMGRGGEDDDQVDARSGTATSS